MSNRNYYIDLQLSKLDPEKQAHLRSQVDNINYDLFKALEHRENNESARGMVSPIGAVEVNEIAAREAEFRAIGLDAIRACKVGAVLLAGGQGTRLGADGPKGSYNVGVTKDLYIFECLINNLLDVTNEASAYVPLYIMTSTVNNDQTVSFFKEHNYFGYPEDYVKFFIQEMVPAVDYEGRILMQNESELVLSPNGNGGWYSSMAKTGVLDDVHARGVEWLNVFAVDNVLQRMADPVFVGATIVSGSDSGAKVVRKAAPGEKVGVLCREDGKPSIIEYYEMTDEMANLRREDGELEYGFGVILNYLFSEKKLGEIMNNYMPIHVVEKKIPYMDENGVSHAPTEPNGYKFETLVLDMVHMMDDCLAFEVIREKEFAPIKNLHGVDSVDSARELLEKNGVML